jgi:hypothetical protein
VETQPLAGDALPDWMDGWEAVRADKAGMVFSTCCAITHENKA